MIPITPSGTRIRPTCNPEGRIRISPISPTGSGSAAIWRKPSAIDRMRASVSSSRSSRGAARPPDRPLSRSRRFAAWMSCIRSAIESAMATRAAFLASGGARASVVAAARAPGAEVEHVGVQIASRRFRGRWG